VRGSEVVLVAEDNDQVRELVTRILTPLGYTVIEAANGSEALAAAESCGRPVDLLLSDVIMPEMNGKELADRLTATHPALKVAYMSGYTAEAIVHRGKLAAGMHLIPKPFAPSVLAREVRRALDRDD
jgi:CheY-like chemotaxis protein